MTEEEINALIKEQTEAAEKRAAEAEAAVQAAKAEAEKARNDLNGVVEELTEERKKKQEALEKAKINNTNPETAPTGAAGTVDISKALQEELDRREAERAQNEIKSAVEEFRNSKTEFQNDTAGIVYEKFQKELSKFNFSDITSKEQAKQRLEEAYRFVKQTAPDTFGESSYDGTPSTPPSPKDQEGKLSNDVASTLESTGVSQEKYHKLSAKYGDALSSLGFGS
jgi:hypothetical protein